jgi:hypothetical protein
MLMPSSTATDELRERNLRFFTTPALWPLWPLWPLVRRRPDQEDEMGLLFDALGFSQRPGYSATVFLSNMFLAPYYEDEFLALPKEVYDTPEEVFLAGWRVD